MTPITLVSVIITTYNRADKLKDAIESLLAQTYKNIQIIVADDGSTDETKELVAQYPQVSYYYKENGGQASGRNLGFMHAKGNLIATLDSDDVWYPSFLEKCVEKLESDNFDFVFANWDQDEKGGESWNFLLKDPYLAPYNENAEDGWVTLNAKALRKVYLQACPSPSSSLVFKKSLITSQWREDLHIGDDWYMFLKIVLSQPSKAAYTLERLWNKRVDEINLYDGRKWSEILERLYVADLEIFIQDFEQLISEKEKAILERKHIEGLVELAKHKFVRERKFVNGYCLLRKSFLLNKRFTFSAIPRIFFKAFQRKILSKT
ncbi:glycosyltransferase involved in cell wall biosynthesis [Pedobacter sp. UYP30]|uniref:glycosyltransferase family 2 protein n=1 Tax=Pedobacter sp. UYP30 TaxID=1756400 RepID=UPI003390CD3D